MSKTLMACPLGGVIGNWERPPLMLDTSMVGPLGPRPLGGSDLHPWSRSCVVTCIGSIDRSNSTHESHSPCTLLFYVLQSSAGVRGMSNSV
jgi:hypothetical protein